MYSWNDFLTDIVNDRIDGLYIEELSPTEKSILIKMFPDENSAKINIGNNLLNELNDKITKSTLGNHTGKIYGKFGFSKSTKGVATLLHKKLLNKFLEIRQQSQSSPEKQYVMALDLGTTNIRAFLFSRSGKKKESTLRKLDVDYPCPGWVEHDPLQIWTHTESVISELIASSDISINEISSIGLTVQRETCLLWDKQTGLPLYNAITWEDKRTENYCKEIKLKHGENIYDKTGLIIDPYFSATKIKWLIDKIKEEGRWNDGENILAGTIDTWILWKLTHRQLHVTDHTNASRTMLMNINTLEWDEELLNLFNIPKSILPEIRSSLGNFGKMRTSHSDVSIPITAVLGDQQAALFGHRCNTTGLIKCTYGTGGFVVKFMGSEIPRSNKGLLSTVAWTEKDNSVCYALEGSLFTSGSAVQWLKDGLKIIEDVNDSKVRAENVPDNGGVYFVPAFSGLGVPYWDASARGAFMGITGGTSQDHMIRAVLESMAYQVKEVIDTMDENNGTSTLALKVDGGACVNDFLMQFQADLLGIPIERPRDKDITVQGIAFAAGLASGFWQSLDELYNTPRIDIFRPNLNSTYAKDNFVIWKESVQRMRNWCLPKNNLL